MGALAEQSGKGCAQEHSEIRVVVFTATERPAGAPCAWVLQPVPSKLGGKTTTKSVMHVMDTTWTTRSGKAGRAKSTGCKERSQASHARSKALDVCKITDMPTIFMALDYGVR